MPLEEKELFAKRQWPLHPHPLYYIEGPILSVSAVASAIAVGYIVKLS